MAQTMLLTANVAGHALDLKKGPLIQRLRPRSVFHFFLPDVPTSSQSFSAAPTVSLFKSKTKAPVKKAPVKEKSKVEDGIFGTSGGIGFTKQNELFVGRVAMLGFAASLLGEAITGKGILAQLNLETGIPIYEAEPLLLFFILFNLLGAIGALGDRGRFVDDETAGIEGAVIPPGKGFRAALGLKEGGPLFGFTKANELFVGRLAQLGIAFSIIGEIITGKGALAQLNIETGVPIQDIEPLLLFNVAFFFFAAINPGTGRFLTDEEE
uniref:Photosystem II 22 kDa protein, chloroplastic n=1 Tax=Gymnema sylvestre TaxID=4068 RepID=A0A8K1S5Y0_GYMSY|nr:chloroplast photosystem II 22 kDa protein [Gymnema sylvestre]